MQNDTYDKFMQRVFASPDLMKINEFNTEIQSFIAARMGLLTSSGTGKSKDKKKKKNQQTGLNIPAVVFPRAIPSKKKLTGAQDNMEERHRVDELADVENIKSILSADSFFATPGSFSAFDAHLGGSLTNGPNVAVGASIFDLPLANTRLSETNMRVGVTFPDIPTEKRKFSPSPPKHHHQHHYVNRRIRAPPTEGLLLRSVSERYLSAGSESIKSIAFTSAAEDGFTSTWGYPYSFYRSARQGYSGYSFGVIDDHDAPINHVVANDDMSVIATSGEDARLCLFDSITKARFLVLNHPGPVTCSAFSPNGNYIVSGCVDSKCRLWSTKPSTAPTEMATYCQLHDRITALAFQTIGGLVAAGSQSGEVHLWRGSTAERVHVIAERTLTCAIIGLSFNWNSEILLAADSQHVLFSEVSTGAPLKMLVTGTWLSPQPCRGQFENATMPCFTFATFAPQTAFPNYFLVGKGDCTVILYEFRLEKVEQQKDKHSNQNQNQRSNSVKTMELLLMDELWSTKLKATPTCATAGLDKSMLIGDCIGNAVLLTLEPSAYFTIIPPPQPIKIRKWVPLPQANVL